MRLVVTLFALSIAAAPSVFPLGVDLSGYFSGLSLGARLPSIPTDVTTPVHIRIAVRSASSMAIGWNTYAEQRRPCVWYGLAPSNLTEKACSSASVTYASSRTWAQTVVLEPLQPFTRYHYKIVSTNASTPTLSFMSPRTPGDDSPFSVPLVGDLGVYGEDGYTIRYAGEKRLIPYMSVSPSHTTIDNLVKTSDSYDFVLHPGDLAYADDWYLRSHNSFDGQNAYEAILEQFYDQLSPVSAIKPYMVLPGNHEAACREVAYVPGTCPDGQSNFTDYDYRFRDLMPTVFASTSANSKAVAKRQLAKQLSSPPFWYSFDYGNVHFLMFNTETDFPGAPDAPWGEAGLYSGPFGTSADQQLKFIENDLASVDRSITPWIVASGHRPWYVTSGTDLPPACVTCQHAFEDLFYQYGVDVGVFGHVHNSQRHAPMFRDVLDPAGMNDPKAPLYIISGGAGNIEGLSEIGTRPAHTRFAYADDFSYATLRFLSNTKLQVDFIRSSDNKILDTSVLTKKHDTPFVFNSI